MAPTGPGCGPPGRGWTRGSRGIRSKHGVALPGSSPGRSGGTAPRSCDVGAASMRAGRSTSSSAPALPGRLHRLSAPCPSGERSSNTSEVGEERSLILRGSGLSVRCAPGSSPDPGCPPSSTPSANGSSRSVWPIEGGSRYPTVGGACGSVWNLRHSSLGSSRRTRWTSFPRSPSDGCSSSHGPSIGRACPRSAWCQPAMNHLERDRAPRIAHADEHRLRRMT